nr:MAG TPA_asm: hypothetical protein [Caudoviricetes sp.]
MKIYKNPIKNNKNKLICRKVQSRIHALGVSYQLE